MNFNDLVSSSLAEEIINIDENNLTEFFSKKYPVITLYGNMPYNILYESGDWYIIGEKKVFSSLEKLVDYINEEYDEAVEVPLNEDLAYAKFKYRSKYPDKGYQIHDKHPKVLVLDNDYIYNGKGKIVPGQHDILAFNLNYSGEKKLDKQAVQEITSFAHLIKKDKLDIYKRIKEWRPEVIKHIRHYKPEQMTKLKKKDGWFWRQCSVADLTGDEGWTL